MMGRLYRAFGYMRARLEPADYMLLWLRMWIAHVFFVSGRLKTGASLLTPTESTVMLFEEEYALPLLPPELAAQLAVYAETFLPILLMLGLGARFGAAGLFGMTLVIQFLVYPGHFAEHLVWAAALFAVLAMGAGRVSLDQLIVFLRARLAN